MAQALPRPTHLELELPALAATAALARAIAARARRGDVIALHGELGAGKTAFARAFIQALAGAAGEEVPSPTFTLVQTYERAPAPVWHFDLFRLARPEEVLELGLEEALAEAISVIEWPERLGPLLPRDRLDLHLEFEDGAAANAGARRARLVGHGSWARRLMDLARAGRA